MRILFLPLFSAGLALAASSFAQEAPSQRLTDYDDCVILADFDPNAALREAEAWSRRGGGRAARHCAAVALLAKGNGYSAGNLLLDLAKEEEAEPGVAARLTLQAAEAYIADGYREEAYRALERTYSLAPDSPAVHMAAAPIYAEGKFWTAAENALLALERHALLSADAFALRGKARFELGRFAEAASDVGRALELYPYSVDALVLRGNLKREGFEVEAPPFQ